MGTPKICANYCLQFETCLEVNEADIKRLPLKHEWKRFQNPKNISKKSKICIVCNKPITRFETKIGPTKGMFAMHYKAKHPYFYQEYKAGRLEITKMLYVGIAKLPAV